MKNSLAISAICMAAMMAACGSKQHSDESQEAMADSMAIENVVEEETVSPDYVMLNLKERVKSYVIQGFCWRILGSKVEFNEAGLVVKIDGENPNLERNDKGQIVKYSYKEADDSGDMLDCSKEYEYDESGRLTKITTCSYCGDWESEFDRDDDGNIVTWKNISAVEGTIPFKYKYSGFDEQGNWTKLSEGSEVSTRTLTYWE